MSRMYPNNMVETLIHFGILGCTDIACKVLRAITLAPNARLYAIGSHSSEKATRFTVANRFPPSSKIYGNSEAVLDDPDWRHVRATADELALEVGGAGDGEEEACASGEAWMRRSWIRFWRHVNPMECSWWTTRCSCTTLGRLRWRSCSPIHNVSDNSNQAIQFIADYGLPKSVRSLSGPIFNKVGALTPWRY